MGDIDPIDASAPSFSWTGFYLGLNAGFISNRDRLNGSVPALDAILPGAGALALRQSSDGFTGGGQIGYNYQLGAAPSIVLGIEADFAYRDTTRTAVLPVPLGLGLKGSYRNSLRELGTLRGRLGYAFGQPAQSGHHECPHWVNSYRNGFMPHDVSCDRGA